MSESETESSDGSRTSESESEEEVVVVKRRSKHTAKPHKPAKEQLPAATKILKAPSSAAATTIVAAMDEQLRKSPSTFKLGLPAKPWKHLQFYCAAKSIPIVTAHNRQGQQPTKEELVTAIQQACQDSTIAELPMAKQTLSRKPPKGSKRALAEAAAKGEQPVVEPHASPQAYDIDVGELEAGNDSPQLWARVRATLAMLVQKGQLSKAEEAAELSEIKSRCPK